MSHVSSPPLSSMYDDTSSLTYRVSYRDSVVVGAGELMERVVPTDGKLHVAGAAQDIGGSCLECDQKPDTCARGDVACAEAMEADWRRGIETLKPLGDEV